MSKIEEALARLNNAMDTLEGAFEAAGESPPVEGDAGNLHEEIRVLRARAQEDAKLRSEAAGAVREALRDLRGAMTRGQTGEQANA